MLHLNLLPAEIKQETETKRIYSLTKRIFGVLILLTVAASIIFVGAKIFVINDFKKFAREDQPAKKTDNQDYAAKIKAINEELAAVTQIQKEFTPYSGLVADITGRVPSGISLSLLKIDGAEKTVRMSGRAKTRSDLLSLKENLIASPILLDVDLPVQNILEKENINFDLDMKLNPEKTAN